MTGSSRNSCDVLILKHEKPQFRITFDFICSMEGFGWNIMFWKKAECPQQHSRKKSGSISLPKHQYLCPPLKPPKFWNLHSLYIVYCLYICANFCLDFSSVLLFLDRTKLVNLSIFHAFSLYVRKKYEKIKPGRKHENAAKSVKKTS